MRFVTQDSTCISLAPVKLGIDVCINAVHKPFNAVK